MNNKNPQTIAGSGYCRNLEVTKNPITMTNLQSLTEIYKPIFAHPRIYQIYSLNCPITDEIKYIGQTYTSLKKRLNKHISDSRNPVVKVQCWIKSLTNKGLLPVMRLVEVCSKDNIDERETFYIAKYRSIGFDLKNISAGGAVRRDIAKETRDKISKSLRGQIQSEETKKKRSQSSSIAWSDPALRAMKSRQTKLLNDQGRIGTKGKAISTRKKVDMPLLLQQYGDISIEVKAIANYHKIDRSTLYEILRRENIPLRKPLKMKLC